MNQRNDNNQVKGKPLGVVVISVITLALVGLHFFLARTSESQIFALFGVIAIYGFWTYQIWGYRLILIFYILQIAIFVYYGYYDPQLHRIGSVKDILLGLIFGIVISGPIILYLFTNRIKSIFFKK